MIGDAVGNGIQIENSKACWENVSWKMSNLSNSSECNKTANATPWEVIWRRLREEMIYKAVFVDSHVRGCPVVFSSAKVGCCLDLQLLNHVLQLITHFFETLIYNSITVVWSHSHSTNRTDETLFIFFPSSNLSRVFGKVDKCKKTTIKIIFLKNELELNKRQT